MNNKKNNDLTWNFSSYLKTLRPFDESDFDLTHKHYLKTQQLPKNPRDIVMELTTKCQLSCNYCDVKQIKRTGIMPDNVFQTAIKKMAESNIDHVNLNGIGEPFLDKKIFERIRFAKKHGIETITFVTNGLLLDEKKSAQLIESGITQITISLDGNSQAALEKTRPGANFELIVENIKKLIHFNEKLGRDSILINLRTTLVDENIDDAFAVYKRWHNKVNRIIFKIAYDYENIRINSVTNTNWAKRIVCPEVRNSLLILSNGNTVLCCSGDIHGTQKTGNILRDSFESCFNGDIAKSIRSKHFDLNYESLPACNKCSLSTLNSLQNKWISHHLNAYFDTLLDI